MKTRLDSIEALIGRLDARLDAAGLSAEYKAAMSNKALPSIDFNKAVHNEIARIEKALDRLTRNGRSEQYPSLKVLLDKVKSESGREYDARYLKR